MKKLLLVLSIITMTLLSGCAENDNIMPDDNASPMMTARPGDAVNPVQTDGNVIPNND